MSNADLLRQAREGIKRAIELKKSVILIHRNIMVDDGAGEGNLVPDPLHVGDPVTVTCRISKETRPVEKVGTASVGLTTNFQRYILVDHEATINEHESFEAFSKRWRIGPVETLYRYDGVIGYRAPLKEAEEAPGGDT